jgi:hypothetical protein
MENQIDNIIAECETARQSNMTREQIEKESDSAKSPFLQKFHEDLNFLNEIDALRKANVKFSVAVTRLNQPKKLKSIQKIYLQREDFLPFLDGKLVETNKGLLVPVADSPLNMEILITKVLGMTPRLNTLKNKYMLGDKDPSQDPLDELMGNVQTINERFIEDGDQNKIANAAKDYRLLFSDKHIEQVLWSIADKNKFHPFKSYVESKAWDGTDRISQLSATITIREQFRINASCYDMYLQRWLIGVVAKVYHPGSQNTVLTLHGDQAVGKSRWIRKLMGIDGCYGEGLLDPNNKDHILKHLDFILFHASELDGTTRKADIAALKDYFTKEDISERPAYGRYDRVGKSICSFAASVNEGQFLNDITGSRRYLVIPVESIDHNHTIDMQQVYAQAKHLLDAGERYWFQTDEIATINENNSAFNVEDHIDELSAKIEPGEDEMALTAIFQMFVDRHKSPGRAELTKLGTMLTKKGIQKQRKMVNGTKLTLYFIKKPTPKY